MDDILLAHPKAPKVEEMLIETIKQLTQKGLIVAPKKVQRNKPLSYLGQWIHNDYIATQKVAIKKDKLRILNDFQKMLGDINWIRSHLKITTGNLSPPLSILQGDPDPRSPKTLTTEAIKALQLIEKTLEQARVKQLDYTQPWSLFIFATEYTPTACLWQRGILEWLHLPHTQSKMLAAYPYVFFINEQRSTKISRIIRPGC